MSVEYHNRTIEGHRLSWDVERLNSSAAALDLSDVALDEILEFDQVYWFDEEFQPTCRAVIEHMRRIETADTSQPILLSPDGYVVDGMHRVARAMIDGATTISARRLIEYPTPDRTIDVGS